MDGRIKNEIFGFEFSGFYKYVSLAYKFHYLRKMRDFKYMFS